MYYHCNWKLLRFIFGQILIHFQSKIIAVVGLEDYRIQMIAHISHNKLHLFGMEYNSLWNYCKIQRHSGLKTFPHLYFPVSINDPILQPFDLLNALCIHVANIQVMHIYLMYVIYIYTIRFAKSIEKMNNFDTKNIKEFSQIMECSITNFVFQSY